MEFLADCRARMALDLLASTWHGVVLWALRHGPGRPVTLLLGPLEALGQWADRHGDAVMAAQDRAS